MNPCLTVVCLCLGLAFGAPRPDPDLDGHWQLWKSWHNKAYHEVSARGCRLASARRRPSWALLAESPQLCLNAGCVCAWGG